MADRWGRRVDWQEVSGAVEGRVDGQVIVSIGDASHCRDLLAATLGELRETIEDCDRQLKDSRVSGAGIDFRLREALEADDLPRVLERLARNGMIDPWHGEPRLYEELYWKSVSDSWLPSRRTPGLPVKAYMGVGRIFGRLKSLRTMLTVDVEGVVRLGPVPATPNNLREWIAQGRADDHKARGRRRGQAAPTAVSTFFQEMDADRDATDLFAGQAISESGDKQRCEQLMAAAAEDLKSAIPDCEHLWTLWMGDDQRRLPRARLWLEAEDRLPRRVKTGMLLWEGEPRLYEELHWEQDYVDRRWSQNRHTPGLNAEVVLPVALSQDESGKRRSWKRTLTVSRDGVGQLGPVPATPDNLREWFCQCIDELPAVPRSDPDRPKHEGSVISQSSAADLLRTRSKLLEARRVLHEEMERWSQQSPDRRTRLREATGTATEPGMISVWRGQPRMFEGVYWWQGPESNDPWTKLTRTLGYRWRYSPVGRAVSHDDILMTVSADGVVESP
jgi:hypothetical protein